MVFIKDLIVSKLSDLRDIYKTDKDKIWQLKALNVAIRLIKDYDKPILSGIQLEKDIKGIGKKISARIQEIIDTGDLQELYDITNNQTHIKNILLITGVGLVKAKQWVSQGIKDINDVIRARDNKLITTTHHIDLGIKYYNDFQKMIPRSEVKKLGTQISKVVKKIDKNFLFEICGSYRRGKKQSSDIDILISHPDYYNNIESQDYLNKIITELKKQNIIIDSLTSLGKTKFMGVCNLINSSDSIPRRIDIRIVDYESFYTALIYFTGSKDFNLFLRQKATEKNYKLSEYALTKLGKEGKEEKAIFIKSEEELFKILDIEYVKPIDRM